MNRLRPDPGDVLREQIFLIRQAAKAATMETAINQAISNLQAIANLTDDPYITEIVRTTADLLFAAIGGDTL